MKTTIIQHKSANVHFNSEPLNQIRQDNNNQPTQILNGIKNSITFQLQFDYF